MQRIVAVLATLDTKAQEAEYIRQRIEENGDQALIIDMGVVAPPGIKPDISREEVAAAGGTTMEDLLNDATREKVVPVLCQGAIHILQNKIASDSVHALLGLGGTQGTTACTQVMQALPYGLPKIMVSTIASGDTSAFVGIKDITMMFSVGDLLGLNAFTRMVLSNAVGAACGMAQIRQQQATTSSAKPMIGMSNLGVLTAGAMEAVKYFEEAGYEVLVFHAVGSGGQAMEQMMKEGLIGGVFDYAMGEISDEVFHGLRAGGSERLTVAGKLGIPQVLCPGGAEHIGIIVDEPNQVPEKYKNHKIVFHSPIIAAPRLTGAELEQVAAEITMRLRHTKDSAVFFIPAKGSSRYGVAEGPLYDPEGDEKFFSALKAQMPETIKIEERDTHAEDPGFVREAAQRLIDMLERP